MNAQSWTKLVLDALRILVWPATIAIFVLMFQQQLRERLGLLVQAELPGGIKLKLDALQREVRSTPEVEVSGATSLGRLTAEGTVINDRLYAVAGVRVDLDRLLRQLSRAGLRDREFATRDLNDIILDRNWIGGWPEGRCG